MAKQEASVLVTGGGGFIGRAVVRRLVADGADVRVHLGPPGVALVGPAGSPVITAAIDDAEAVDAMVDGVAAVVHLAGPPSVAASFADPVGYARAHVAGTAVLLEACRRHAVRRLVHVSSAEIYGRPAANPVAEDARPQPRSPYAAMKLGAEHLVTTLAPRIPLSAVVLRLFSVYGAQSHPGSLVGSLLRQVAAGGGLTVADPRPVRDYVHVDDVAVAVLRALKLQTGAESVIYNIGSGAGTSVAQLAGELLRVVGRADRLDVLTAADRPAGVDILELVADTTRAESGLGWQPSIGLRTGLERALAEFRAGTLS